MARRSTMVITWMDGQQESYPFTHQETAGGELHLWTEYPGSMSMQQRYDERWFPVGNIRVRTAADVP